MGWAAPRRRFEDQPGPTLRYGEFAPVAAKFRFKVIRQVELVRAKPEHFFGLGLRRPGGELTTRKNHTPSAARRTASSRPAPGATVTENGSVERTDSGQENKRALTLHGDPSARTDCAAARDRMHMPTIVLMSDDPAEGDGLDGLSRAHAPPNP